MRPTDDLRRLIQSAGGVARVIYLDSCAAIKLVLPEPESAALVDWLEQTGEPIMSSGLLRVELHRALTRVSAGPEAREQANALLNGVHLRPVDAILERAAALDGMHLRSLDAIHLATALSPGTRPTLVTYDQRLASHATEAGLTIAAPTG